MKGRVAEIQLALSEMSESGKIEIVRKIEGEKSCESFSPDVGFLVALKKDSISWREKEQLEARLKALKPTGIVGYEKTSLRKESNESSSPPLYRIEYLEKFGGQERKIWIMIYPNQASAQKAIEGII